MFVKNFEERLPSVTVVQIPKDVNGKLVDELLIRKQLLEKYNIDISGGLGPTAGKVWRIGLMGKNATFEMVALLLNALRDVMSIKSNL